MRTWLDLLETADCGEAMKALPIPEHVLSDEELHNVAGGGGKAGVSSNPVED